MKKVRYEKLSGAMKRALAKLYSDSDSEHSYVPIKNFGYMDTMVALERRKLVTIKGPKVRMDNSQKERYFNLVLEATRKNGLYSDFTLNLGEKFWRRMTVDCYEKWKGSSTDFIKIEAALNGKPLPVPHVPIFKHYPDFYSEDLYRALYTGITKELQFDILLHVISIDKDDPYLISEFLEDFFHNEQEWFRERYIYTIQMQKTLGERMLLEPRKEIEQLYQPPKKAAIKYE